MDLRAIMDSTIGWMKQNDNLVLTGIAIGGVLGTGVLAFKAGYDVALDKKTHGVSADPVQRIKDTWLYYVPTVCSAGITIFAIIAAHKASARRQAAIAGALALSEKTFYEYRNKVAEVVSHRKAEEVMEEVTADRIKKNPPWNSEIAVTGNGDTLCYDTYTGRYFQSTRQQIDNAVNMLNSQLNNHRYASVNDFYGFLGLDSTEAGSDLGWNSDNLLEVSYSSHLSNDDRPCLAVYLTTAPKPNYWRGL